MGDLEIFSKCHPGNILETLFYLFGGCYRSIVTVFTAKDCNAAITFYFPVATIIVIRIHHVIFMWCLCGRSITMVIYSLGGFTNLGALHAVSVIINFMIGSPQKDWTVIANKFGRILRSYLSVAVSTWWSGDSLYINGVPPRLMGGNDFTCPKCIYIHTYCYWPVCQKIILVSNIFKIHSPCSFQSPFKTSPCLTLFSSRDVEVSQQSWEVWCNDVKDAMISWLVGALYLHSYIQYISNTILSHRYFKDIVIFRDYLRNISQISQIF